MWLDSSPDLVADVLIECAVSAIRSGEEIIPDLERLAHMKNHAQVARHASMPHTACFSSAVCVEADPRTGFDALVRPAAC